MNCKNCKQPIAAGTKKCSNCGKDQRKFFMRHKILTVFLACCTMFMCLIVFIIIAAISSAITKTDADKENIAVGTTVQPRQSAEKGGKGNESTSSITPAPPEIIKVTSIDLAKAFEDNEVKAEKEYKNKMAEITGKISSIGVMFGQTSISLSSGKEFSLSDVICYFDDESEVKKIEELKKGETITIIGIIDGKSLNVTVEKCKLK